MTDNSAFLTPRNRDGWELINKDDFLVFHYFMFNFLLGYQHKVLHKYDLTIGFLFCQYLCFIHYVYDLQLHGFEPHLYFTTFLSFL